MTTSLTLSKRVPSVLTAHIGRGHLDTAEAEGHAAGLDPAKVASDCPYNDRTSPMTVKAWERGFHAARADSAD